MNISIDIINLQRVVVRWGVMLVKNFTITPRLNIIYHKNLILNLFTESVKTKSFKMTNINF
ncbi:hypothetical protein CH69_153 [Francisella tularensis subsp. tularensis]|uniref:50S rRNA methyltransferase n=1 Tax=Francisella tularensis TaxID=263 RepID=A0AAW3D531_FRATU|nr:hypothetical protein BZ14_492 [Francisella tularensis subsp. tularensis SCHU S4]AJI71087.1 hypothetical protein CH69_153 [Francisella tularensis subsp. tularensis]KFJ39761.1 hypothetical protein DR87_2001 [Francisella tularensis]KFJ60296.1 hypothetical protein DR80_2021 [Francisella tularensis]KFJ68815.1 hypothetical protein DR84_1998 [Francisella tularensis]